jgi:ubiquinone/menaquinone biosynthesis C-methylase UbiE
MNDNQDTESSLNEIRTFYDSVYYQSADTKVYTTSHLRSLARRLGVKPDQQVLDIACGTGQWLLACQELGALVSGVDISEKAIEICSENIKSAECYCSPAESLPFDDDRFDIVTCLGSLEHFVDPHKALKEMIRVAKTDAVVVLLVPNADFLTRKLGLYHGTQQVAAKEEVRTLDEWQNIFEAAGLQIIHKWKDLHVISRAWIASAGWRSIPLRAFQAIALIFWPLKWQYQIYHLCKIRH